MRYDTRIDELETKGITYHREVAKFLSNKIDEYNNQIGYNCSVLIIGESDLYISKTIAKKHKIHVLAKKRGEINDNLDLVFEDMYKEAHIIPVLEDSFDVNEYDLVIFLFSNIKYFKEMLSKYPSIRFIFIPNYLRKNLYAPEVSKDIKAFLSNKGICFTIERCPCKTMLIYTYSNLPVNTQNSNE